MSSSAFSPVLLPPPPAYSEYAPVDHEYRAGTRFSQISPNILQLHQVLRDTGYEHAYCHTLVIPSPVAAGAVPCSTTLSHKPTPADAATTSPRPHPKKRKLRKFKALGNIILSLNKLRTTAVSLGDKKRKPVISRALSTPDIVKSGLQTPKQQKKKIKKSVSFSKDVNKIGINSTEKTTYSVNGYRFTQL